MFSKHIVYFFFSPTVFDLVSSQILRNQADVGDFLLQCDTNSSLRQCTLAIKDLKNHNNVKLAMNLFIYA